MSDSHYVGTELEVFAQATNWKKYWSSKIQPYLTGDVLEVGAGLGASTRFLKSPRCSSWTCLEPDPGQADNMRSSFLAQELLANCRVETGSTDTLETRYEFDTIIYIDVLEHIEDDREEMARASRLLRTGGKIIVLAPAHQWLYTAFDSAIGHYRRYDIPSLSAISPADCDILHFIYLDSAGMLASLGNRFFLHKSAPALNQILLWDRCLVPCSRLLDVLTMHKIGKSILGIWKKD